MEAPENGKELLHSAHYNGMNEWMVNMDINYNHFSQVSVIVQATCKEKQYRHVKNAAMFGTLTCKGLCTYFC